MISIYMPNAIRHSSAMIIITTSTPFFDPLCFSGAAEGLTEGVTEELKAADPMKWVGLMNNLRNAAEETVLSELIYN